MAPSNYLLALCILLFLVAATNIAYANNSYGNGPNLLVPKPQYVQLLVIMLFFVIAYSVVVLVQ